MKFKSTLIVLLVMLLGVPIVLGASPSYYGRSYVYFNIPIAPYFNNTLPNTVQYQSSDTGQQTADEEFNSTSGNEKNVTVYVTTTSYRQNSTVIGDETNVSNFKINNTGNVNENITMCINASLPASIKLFGTKTADPYNSPSVIPDCSSGVWIANSSLVPNAMAEFWIWTNFTSVTASDESSRELYVNATQSGT